MKSYYGVPRPMAASLAFLRQRLARLTRFHFETFPTSAQELELFLQKHWQNTLDGMYNRELTILYHLAPESIDQFLDLLENAIVSFAEVPPTTEVPPTRERILERQYVSLWHLLGWKGAASRDLAAQILCSDSGHACPKVFTVPPPERLREYPYGSPWTTTDFQRC